VGDVRISLRYKALELLGADSPAKHLAAAASTVILPPPPILLYSLTCLACVPPSPTPTPTAPTFATTGARTSTLPLASLPPA